MMHAADVPPAAFRIPEKLYVEGFSLITAMNERFITTNSTTQKIVARARGALRMYVRTSVHVRMHARQYVEVHYDITLQNTL